MVTAAVNLTKKADSGERQPHPAKRKQPSSSNDGPTPKKPSDYCKFGGSSRDILLTLIEITFRPHSPHCCSFTAVIRDGCDGRGVSFGQLISLIESIGHAGKIDDFTIKPIEQHSFLLTSFSRHTSFQPSSSGTTVDQMRGWNTTKQVKRLSSKADMRRNAFMRSNSCII